jgi:hypothetical protein
MPSVDTTPQDLRNYKCVPLDLLKNTNAQNQVQFNVTGNDVSLQDMKEDMAQLIVSSGPIKGALSPDEFENYIILPLVSIIIIVFIFVLFFCGYKIATVNILRERGMYIAGGLIVLGIIIALIVLAALKKL